LTREVFFLRRSDKADDIGMEVQMLEVVETPDEATPGDPGTENCCFCFRMTRFWYTPKDVACCRQCALVHSPEQVPTKAEWFTAVQARTRPSLWPGCRPDSMLPGGRRA
jgi:hypothetical protein